MAGPWYHGTDHEFEPGQLLLPPSRQHPTAEPRSPASDPDRVYVTNSPHEAQQYGQHVYEVRPKGRLERDHYFEHARSAVHATVLNRVQFADHVGGEAR